MKNGFPFISLNALLEIAGTDNYELFTSRINQLSSLDCLYTLNVTDSHIPGSIIDLHAVEIQGILTNCCNSLEEKTHYINSRVSKVSNKYLVESIPSLYEYAFQNKSNTNLLSSINDHLLNPFRNKKIKDIGDMELDYSKNDRVNAFREKLPEFIQKRGKDISKSTSDNIAGDFLKKLDTLKEKNIEYTTVRSLLTNLVGEELDEESKLSYYIELIDFNTILSQVSSLLSLSNTEKQKLKMGNITSFILKRKIKDIIEIEVKQDNRRPFELSNHVDTLLASYSFVFKTVVDKRIYPILEKINPIFDNRLLFCKEGTL